MSKLAKYIPVNGPEVSFAGTTFTVQQITFGGRVATEVADKAGKNSTIVMLASVLKIDGEQVTADELDGFLTAYPDNDDFVKQVLVISGINPNADDKKEADPNADSPESGESAKPIKAKTSKDSSAS